MTQKEIEKFLANTKVYVNGKSKEIQEKLFYLGYSWNDGSSMVDNVDKPFLFIDDYKTIRHSDDMVCFTNYNYREITADEILTLELTEPSYRPFKSQEECWNEMLKHQPFGWIYSKNVSCYYCIISVDEDKIELSPEMQPHSETTIKEYYMENSYVGFVTALEDYEYTFADGTPFGIKEEQI